MKTRFALAACITLYAVSLPALAHDPKEHLKEGGTAPDCAKMRDMDMSKMDMNDPVMKAMHAKCMNQANHDTKAVSHKPFAGSTHDDMKSNGHNQSMGDMPAMDMGAKSHATKPKQ